MADPTFNGQSIFGVVVEFTHDDRPNAAQINHYPGTNGVERLDMGVAATYITARGTLCSATTQILGSAIDQIRAMKNNATVATLYDTDGLAWPNCLIEHLTTHGRTMPSNQGWCKDYEIRFLLLNL